MKNVKEITENDSEGACIAAAPLLFIQVNGQFILAGTRRR
ncbi:hypothetical protein QFZ78_006736 [Paenibacillus sp. V4I5]|nr:hypothetical protein [Paenibacillus sp. V4I5]